jgi:hypothetical protein
MDIWVLVIIYGITGWGAGGRHMVEFPSETACYKALEATKITGQNQAAGEDDEQVIVYCKPQTDKGG